jgi:hypothetical protein
MEAQAIYRKSDKGTQAIGSRALGVSGKLRMLLILVDGIKKVEELQRLAAQAMIGEPDQLLEQLLADGLIELESAGAPDPAQNKTLAGSGPADLGKAKAQAARLLSELIGPGSADLCKRIEGAKDTPQFIEAMKLAYSAVRDVKGQTVANLFGQSVETLMLAG